jgi:hypothetical protein
MRYQFASGVASFGYRKWSVATADAVPGGIGTGMSVIPIGYPYTFRRSGRRSA